MTGSAFDDDDPLVGSWQDAPLVIFWTLRNPVCG